MNILLWVLQIFLGVYFLFTGIVHFVLPPGLPAPMAWMYELSPGLHVFSGIAEILAGLGLILPGLTKIQTRLTSLAALGLVFVMIGAAVWHLSRNELANILMNVFLAVLSGFVAYARWKIRPLKIKTNS
ncbi:MAG: DoxX family protein [Anaerolineaceae bacterium]